MNAKNASQKKSPNSNGTTLFGMHRWKFAHPDRTEGWRPESLLWEEGENNSEPWRRQGVNPVPGERQVRPSDEPHALPVRQQDLDALQVVGFGCYRSTDPTGRLSEEEGVHLVPWLDDTSLMLSPYDVRCLMDNLAAWDADVIRQRRRQQSASSSELPDWMRSERAWRSWLRYERFCDLPVSAGGRRREAHSSPPSLPQRAQVEQEKVLRQPAEYSAVGLQYGGSSYGEEDGDAIATSAAVERPPREDCYHPLFHVPEDVPLPATGREHVMIEQTARRVLPAPQLEVLLRLNHRSDPRFAFLQTDHPLFPYFEFLKERAGDPNANWPLVHLTGETRTSSDPSPSITFDYGSDDSDSEDDDCAASNGTPEAVKRTMEKLIPFIRRNGVEFVELVRRREASNPLFRFLDPENAWYPEFVRLLPDDIQRQLSRPSSAPVPSPSPSPPARVGESPTSVQESPVPQSLSASAPGAREDSGDKTDRDHIFGGGGSDTSSSGDELEPEEAERAGLGDDTAARLARQRCAAVSQPQWDEEEVFSLGYKRESPPNLAEPVTSGTAFAAGAAAETATGRAPPVQKPVAAPSAEDKKALRRKRAQLLRGHYRLKTMDTQKQLESRAESRTGPGSMEPPPAKRRRRWS